MPNYTIALAVLGSCLDAGQQGHLTGLIRPWFDAINTSHDPPIFGNMNLDWGQNATSAAHSNLLVYFVPSSTESVIVGSPHFRGGVRTDLAGFTLHPPHASGQAASEVYVGEHNGSLTDMAITVFHEAMHNQLYLGDAMHSHGGAAGSPGTVPNTQNITEMAQHIRVRRSQWTGGWAVYQRLHDDLESDSSIPL
jgi:hypothetical protein